MRDVWPAVVLVGLVTAGGAVAGGRGSALAAGGAGVFAGVIHLVAVGVLRPSLVPPFEGTVGRWMVGLGLRFGAVAAIAAALLAWPDLFPALPTALGFLGVLIPLLFAEMWLVWRAMSGQ